MSTQLTPAEIAPATITDLQSRLRGQLLTPASAGYDDARALWNAMIDRKPALIARCLGTQDILTCVEVARDNGIPLSVKGGGHNIAGLALCDGGLVIDTSLMRGVWVDPARRVANAQPGCLLGDVDRETQLHGLAAILGFVSATGIAGLTLGGGFGYLTRKYGWTTDNVRSIDVVTADGRLVRASEQDNPDLFWGLRGGGGNFGVATNFEYDLYPLGPEVVAGGAAWPIERARDVLRVFEETMNDAPPELTCVAAIRIAPPAPWLAKEIHGKPIVALFFVHSGDVAEGERLAAPIKAMPSKVGDIIQRRSYVSQQALLDATQPKGRRYYWKSEYLASVGGEVFEAAVEHASRMPSPHSAVILFPVGGSLNELSSDHSAVGNRDARFVLNITGSWERAEDDAANIEWARAAWRDMRRFSTGGTYVNFLTEEESDERVRSAFRDNMARLVEVKTRWDPMNLFRVNKNIAPGTA